MSYVAYALLAAVAAAFTAILAKVGVRDVPPQLATAVRTSVLLLFAWGLVVTTGEYRAVSKVSGRAFLFLGLSGIATAISWLAYMRALQLGPASRVAPLDKSSLALTVVLAAVFLREPISLKLAIGVALMVIGALLTIG